MRASRIRIAAAVLVAGVSPLLIGPIALNAYDLWPAFLIAAALLAFVRRRERTAYVLLRARGRRRRSTRSCCCPSPLVETWERGGRERVRRSLAWFVGVLLLVHLPRRSWARAGLRYSYWVQVKRGLELESLGGSVLLALDRLGLLHVPRGDRARGRRTSSAGSRTRSGR